MVSVSQLSLITDEISQDLEHSCQIAQQFGISAVELRGVWKKNIAHFSNGELDKAKQTMVKFNIKTSVVCGPFGKCVMPGSKFAQTEGQNLSRNPTYNLGLFDRLVEIADILGTKTIRIFNFFKLGSKMVPDIQNTIKKLLLPYVEKAEKAKKVLVLENEHVCFADTAVNTLKFLEAVNSPALKLNLDPGNFYSAGDKIGREIYEPFYQKGYVAHMHVKDPKFRLPLVGSVFGIVGKGKINYEAIFKQALAHDYSGYFTLETHSPKNREQISISSLQYMAGVLSSMKKT